LLRFFAFLLEANIQSGSHDSVEDARTALKLYRIYIKLLNDDEKKLRDSLKVKYF
jgi:PAB-dependent poly(A)-specific ribonuclease subunit 2